MATGTRNMAQRGRGFTLIELLVVVAIIALLIGILLPSLAGARRAAWQISGSSMQRQLALGAQMYAAENKLYLPGVNGNALRIWNADLQGNITGYIDQSNRDPGLPTQTYDWMTASVTADDLPINRVERMAYLLSRYRDPSMNQTVVPYAGGQAGTSDAIAWVNSTGKLPFGTSFLMPAQFQWGGRTLPSDPIQQADLTSNPPQIYQFNSPFTNPFGTPTSYRPRLDSIQLPAKKICVADGFRYHDGGILDIDMGVLARTYGTFTSSGAIFARSTEYGAVGSNNPSNGAQMPLSYRHSGKMNVSFWDGHGDTLTIKQSRDPIYWYPSESRYSGTDAVPEVAELGYTTGEKVP